MGNFDVDLDFGQIHEEKVRKLFEGEGSIEVKTERDIWADTCLLYTSPSPRD